MVSFTCFALSFRVFLKEVVISSLGAGSDANSLFTLFTSLMVHTILVTTAATITIGATLFSRVESQKWPEPSARLTGLFPQYVNRFVE